METIWIARISHKHGENHYAARDYNTVFSAVDKYVQEWWANELPDEEMPTHDDDRVEKYFDRVYNEDYEIEEVDIIGT